MEIILILSVVTVLFCGPLGWWIATQKGRTPVEGAILGAGFGLIGVLLEALLPTDNEGLQAKRAAWERDAPKRERAARRHAEMMDRLTIDGFVLQRKWEQDRRERNRRLAAAIRSSPAWEVATPVLVGVLMASPVVAVMILMFTRSQ